MSLRSRLALAAFLIASGATCTARAASVRVEGSGGEAASVFSDKGYPGLYTADAHCIRENLARYPTRSYSKFGEAAGDCGIVVPDLTNDHQLQLAARIIGAPYVISVKSTDGMDNWAVCRPQPGSYQIDWIRARYGCQWLNVLSAPADRGAVDATLPRHHTS